MDSLMTLLFFCLLSLVLGVLIGLKWGKKHAQSVADQRLEDFFQKFMAKNLKSSQEGMDLILKPFKENIEKFEKKVEKAYSQESRERFALKNEVSHITEINKKMTDETEKLIKALKGDVKSQGVWGEMILEKILQSAGLVEGDNYILQGKDLKMRDEDKRLQKPDVVVLLPDNKQVVIDSKVSLTSYERALSAAKSEQNAYRRDFLKALENHILDLSKKSYHQSEKLQSFDFTLMFVPIEGAFHLALKEDPHFFTKSLKSSVVPVSPTTLLIVLRSVNFLWKLSSQQQNSQEIALEAGKLYDKFASFVTSLESVGHGLDQAREHYDQAFLRLKTGSGNLIDKAQKLQKLGLVTKKSLNKEL